MGAVAVLGSVLPALAWLPVLAAHARCSLAGRTARVSGGCRAEICRNYRLSLCCQASTIS
jgi:hypothetical protein